MVDIPKIKSSVTILIQYSMQYGFALGVFWVLKYIFFIFFDLFDQLWFVWNLLNIGTLLIYYVLVNRYRDRGLGGVIGYRQCISFSVLLFFFASLIESIIIYVHIAIINPNFLSQHGRIAIHMIEELFREIFSNPTQSINIAKPLKLASNAEYIINNIYVSTLYGFLLSLFYGIFVRRKTPKQNL